MSCFGSSNSTTRRSSRSCAPRGKSTGRSSMTRGWSAQFPILLISLSSKGLPSLPWQRLMRSKGDRQTSLTQGIMKEKTRTVRRVVILKRNKFKATSHTKKGSKLSIRLILMKQSSVSCPNCSTSSIMRWFKNSQTPLRFSSCLTTTLSSLSRRKCSVCFRWGASSSTSCLRWTRYATPSMSSIFCGRFPKYRK